MSLPKQYSEQNQYCVNLEIGRGSPPSQLKSQVPQNLNNVATASGRSITFALFVNEENVTDTA